MKPSARPDPRLATLPLDAVPELQESFKTYMRTLGFVPNSILIMQRKPKLVKAMAQLAAAVWDPEGEVPVPFKRMLAHVASRAHGCHY